MTIISVKQFFDAIEHDDADIVRGWILAGNSVNDVVGKGKDPPLTIAVIWQAANSTKTILNLGADIEQRNEFTKTSLIIASSLGWLEGVKLLLAAGANANAANDRGYSALFETVNDRTKERLEILRLLIKSGADVNAALRPNERVKHGWGNVLMNAAQNGSRAMLTELINAGAEFNRIYSGGTALTVAVEENRPDNVALLLERGADPSIAKFDDCPYDFNGMTALEIAKAKKLKKIVALLESGGKPQPLNPAAVPTVKESWKGIKAALKEQDRLENVSLNKPATAAALSKAATKWGVTLPEEFVESYRLHNGQASEVEDLIPSPTGGEFDGTFQLLPLDEIDSEWAMWKELVDGGEFTGTTSDPDKGIRDDWWNTGWIPFAANGGGDSICLDLNPAKEGRMGQVITMNHETSERRLLANSFAEWLAEFAETITNPS